MAAHVGASLRHRTAATLALIGTLLECGALAACSGRETSAELWLGEPFDQRVEATIEEAEAGGASAAQLEAIRQAGVDGEVSEETARAAANAAIECITAAGLQASPIDVQSNAGLTIPGYRVALPGGEPSVADGLIAGCDRREFEWISRLYQSQPSARELTGQYVMSKEPELRACLEELGVSTSEDDDGWELAQLALTLDGGTDCLTQVGIDRL